MTTTYITHKRLNEHFKQTGMLIMYSLNYTLPIKLTVSNNRILEGIVTKLDYEMKYLIIEVAEENETILIKDIIKAESVIDYD